MRNLIKSKVSKYFLYTLLCAFLVGCKNDQNVIDTIEWIEKSEKPVQVTKHSMNGWTLENRYTLIDNKGKIYSTGCVELTLPKTIIAH